ncbi:MAG: hypothetical protein EHM28_01015 [Spirochaetaceae bacterium]|nr:MAG: hypothetical protein EHM28_01015 [Spirochaetaceae bacterium]
MKILKDFFVKWRKFGLNILLAVCPILTIVIDKNDANWIWYLGSLVALIIICFICIQWLENKETHAKKVTDFIMYIRGVYDTLNFKKDSLTRIMIYLFDKQSKILRQVTPYYPEQDDDNYYGSFVNGLPITKGVAGQAYREGNKNDDLPIIRYIIKKGIPFVNQMMNFGFTEAEAKKLRSDRKSYLSIPVKDNRRNVFGVIFMDSAEENTFEQLKRDAILPKIASFMVPYLKGCQR